AQKRAAGTREAVLLDVVRYKLPHAHPTIRLILRSAHALACARLEGWAAPTVPLMLRDAAARLLSMRARERLSMPLENLAQALRCQRQAGDRARDTDGVINGGGDRCAHRVDAALPRSLEPERIERRRRVLRDHHVERRQLARGGHQVIGEVDRERLAALVV